jgi:hypothetical protein
MSTYTYLPHRDKWRVELDGLVAMHHDLSEAMRRVIDQVGTIDDPETVDEQPAMDCTAGAIHESPLSVTAITDRPQELA